MKKTFITIMIILCQYCILQAQTVSPYLFGQNAWLPYAYGNEVYNGQLDQLWTKVKDSKVKMIRIGGIAPDLSKPTMNQYVAMIDSIRSIGAEPLVQVPFGRGMYTANDAATIVQYINLTMQKNIRYWSISNEPNLPTHGYSAVPVATVESYIKTFSSAMKAIDPSILICGPEYAWYDANEFSALIGGANDISGKDVNGRYYLDIVTFHTYPFGGTQTRADVIQQPVNGFENSVNSLSSLIANANIKNNRTGSNALRWALTEFNVNYFNPAQNTVAGVGCHSFLNGQFWAEYFGIAMKHNALAVLPWSIHESGGNRTTYDLGYLDNATTFLPRSSYFHEKMMADNFSGQYINSIDNQMNVKTFACKKGNETVVMLMNQEETLLFNYTLSLNTNTLTGSGLLVNVDAGLNQSIADRIEPQTTLILTFEASGYLVSKEIYSLQHAQLDQAPQKLVQRSFTNSNTIPGEIQAEAYDDGGSALAYRDISVGNEGNVFRNDDVDIEACTDEGGGYDLGWLEANEWLEYTLNVSKSGHFQVVLRVASLVGGGQMRLYANGKDISGLINIPVTGGWQNWQNVIVSTISPIEMGENILHLQIVSGGFNLNKFTFTIPPKVEITHPLQGDTIFEEATVNITTTVDGSLAKVVFLNGNEWLGEDTTPPYSINWSPVISGIYTIKARAIDNYGSYSDDDSVNIVVNKKITSIPNAPLETIIIGPNPVNTVLRFGGIIANISLFDMAGQSIVSCKSCDHLELKMIPAGIYFAQINYNQIIKIIKE